MEKINKTVETYIQLIGFLLIWGIIVWIIGAGDILPALRQIPVAITIYVIFGLIFKHWVWRWSAIQGWLIKLPNLQGTWVGELKSDWINPATSQPLAPIPITLVIRQTYSSIHITLMTAESNSYSTTADFNVMSGGQELFLTYNYTNRPKAGLRDKSQIHDGAATLKIIRTPKRCLEGEYWTSRKTRGDISVIFKSKKLVEKFVSSQG